jgi:hypothetical protein
MGFRLATACGSLRLPGCLRLRPTSVRDKIKTGLARPLHNVGEGENLASDLQPVP